MEILKENDIVAFDVGLTAKEKDSVEQIQIDQDLPQFDYYGTVDNEKLPEKLAAYLGQLEGNSKEIIDTITGLITRVAKGVQQDFNEESSWLMVRVTLANTEFDIPRWHQDGYYVRSKEGDFKPNEKAYKLVFNVKGAPTRFAEIRNSEKYQRLEEERKRNYLLNYNTDHKKFEEEDLAIRKKLPSAVEETPAISANQAVIYRVGGEDAKVHSEPPIHTPRIFMAALSSSVQQIEEFKERYEK